MYNNLCSFKIEAKNIFLTNNYNVQESKKVWIMRDWLGHGGLRYVQPLNDKEKKNTKQAYDYLRY